MTIICKLRTTKTQSQGKLNTWTKTLHRATINNTLHHNTLYTRLTQCYSIIFCLRKENDNTALYHDLCISMKNKWRKHEQRFCSSFHSITRNHSFTHDKTIQICKQKKSRVVRGWLFETRRVFLMPLWARWKFPVPLRLALYTPLYISLFIC